MENHFN